MRDFDDEDGGEGLHCELCDGRDRADEGILAPFEMGVCLQTKDSAVTKHRFIKDLTMFSDPFR